MSKNTKVKLDQGDSKFIKFFFDLFYRTNQSFTEKHKELLPNNKTIDVLVCGAGSCVHELPVLLMLFESDKYNDVNLTFVDKEKEPFKLLHFILQRYGNNGELDKIEKSKIATGFFKNTPVDESAQAEPTVTTESHASEVLIEPEFDCVYSIRNSKIHYTFHVMDLELDPHETNGTGRYEDFQYFDGKEYDIVMMSMFLQHISYWRSLIAFLNNHLKDGGYFWFNELGKDDFLLTLDFYMAIIDNERKKGEWKDFESSIINYFESNRDNDQMLFSIISDNDEISPTNTEICRDFFAFFGYNGKIIFKEGFQSDIKPSDLFEKAKVKFSPFTKLHSFIEDETLSPTFSENNRDEKMDFTMTWYAYPKVEDEKIKHFDVLDNIAPHMDIPVLQQYINRTLDILNLNTTIFKPTFLRSVETSINMVESAVGLFRRFQLFKIGEFHSIVFYIPGIISSECFRDTKENYEGDFKAQKEFMERIRKYNKFRKESREEGSNSNFFFDKYKTRLTKPFSIFYEPLDHNTNESISWWNIGFEINEYDHSTNRKVHKITVNGKQDDSSVKGTIVTPLGVSYNLSSLRDWYEVYNDYFEGYRSIFIPCFREPLFDKNKEFLGDLILFQEKDKNRDNNTSIEFFSWLIRKFIDFTQIATYFDYKRIILQSLQSAIAALMARNMSHNLGSHYLTNTKNCFRNAIEKVKSNEINLLQADYRGNAHLLQYIQERMDFIATIISGDQYPLESLNFKAEFFDVLTNDDCGERHSAADSPKYEKNFLLQYLLYSEGYTRHGHTCDSPSDNMGDVELQIKLNNRVYTGLKENKNQEESLKMELSKLRLALPGGIMARHALFTLVENILRNAAKHSEHKEKLVLTIEIKETEKNKEKKYELCFYDNCKSANNKIKDENGNVIINENGEEKTIKDLICDKLRDIVIIGEDGKIDKHDKGLKEMLICALWLQNENVAETLYDIQTKKKDVIDSDYLVVGEEDDNLCYKIYVPQWKKTTEIKAEDNVSTNQFLAIHADYIVADDDYFVVIKDGDGFKITKDGNEENDRKISQIFPRFRSGYNESDEANLIEKIKKEANQYTILINHPSKEIKYGNSSVINIHNANPEQLEPYKQKPNIIVFFDHYLNGGIRETQKKLDEVPNALYVDSISGENFTSTLVSPDFLEDDILRKKVIDSAITKIVILDERIWADYRSKWNGSVGKTNDKLSNQLSAIYDEIKDRKEKLKQVWNSIRTNYGIGYEWLWPQIEDKKENRLEVAKTLIKKHLEDGNATNEGGFAQLLMEKKNVFIYTMREDYRDYGRESFLDLSKQAFSESDFNCKFLTVHLGLVEKYLEHNKEKNIKDFLKLIKDCFHPEFISIHSGRGNFSPELEEGLASYPFITLSALDAALGNSKYLLSELFYNTNFIGKGETNK